MHSLPDPRSLPGRDGGRDAGREEQHEPTAVPEFGAGLNEPAELPVADRAAEPKRALRPGRRASGTSRERVPEARAKPAAAASRPAALPSATPEILTWKGLTLSPFQREAITALRAGHDVLVSAPTGAGKTLVAEYAIADAALRGRRCIYTSPIKALSNQKYRDFRDDPAIDVGLMTGDVTIHPTARVLIMTTEILRNAIFENAAQLEDVEYVVLDEVHYMDDPERGSVWEESLIFAPRTMRMLCLSATISNAEELGAWLREIREREVVVIRSSDRPVPLHHALFTEKTGIFEPKELDRVRKRELERGPRPGPRGRTRRGEHDARRGQGHELNLPPRPGALFDELEGQRLLPALVFAFSRKDCERLAHANERRELLLPAEVERMRVLQAELVALFALDPGMHSSEIFAMARRGIGYHHAGMLPIHKELVERMFTSGLLKLLFTTETFALGINMPARSVVFYSLRKFDGVSFDYMSTRDYMQMAGRAGRQGLDKEGLVYSMLSPRDLGEAPLGRYFAGQPEPVESRFKLAFSSILHLVDRLGRARVHEAWEKSFNQFQHRRGTRKEEEHNRREQRGILDAHLMLLGELGYLDGDALTPRGRMARLINGWELQVTELVYRGTLENLPAEALAVVFTGLVFEERRRGEQAFVPAKLHGNVRAAVQREIGALRMQAGEYQLMASIKPPDWGLTAVVLAWMRGASFAELEELTDITAGDIVRHLRMAVQLMRQVRRAVDPEWDLRQRLAEVMEALTRDEVDARAQLELG